MADLTVQNFMSMFNTNKQGDFKTSLDKTHGQLTLRNGKLVNVNRHDRGKTNDIETRQDAPMTEANYNVRMALLDAIKDGGATEDSEFYVATRAKLGLKDSKSGSNKEKSGLNTAKPLSRRTVKAILSDYQAAKKNGTLEKKAVRVHYGFSEVREAAMKAWGEKGWENNYTIDAYNAGIGLSYNAVAACEDGQYSSMPNKYINTFVANLDDPAHVKECKVDGSALVIPENELIAWQAFVKGHADRLNIVDRFKAYNAASEAATREGRTCDSGWASMIKKKGLDETLKRVVIKNVPDLNSDDVGDCVACLKKMIEVKGDDKKKVARDRDEIINDFSWKDGINPQKFRRNMGILFANSLFRQTSKLGLDFFAEKKMHIVFQMNDSRGKHVDDTELDDKWWKADELDEKHPPFVPITHSEMRHLKRKHIAQETTVTKEPPVA